MALFKEIEKHPNYVVDRFGNVYRKFHGSSKVLVPLKPDNSNGYSKVNLDGKKEYIARLVLKAFNPPKNPGVKVFYIDRDKTNCRLENLMWLTASQIQLYSKYTDEYRKQVLGKF